MSSGGGYGSHASARSASSCASAARFSRAAYAGQHHEQMDGWVRQRSQATAQRLSTAQRGRRRALVHHSAHGDRGLDNQRQTGIRGRQRLDRAKRIGQRQRRVHVADRCEDAFEHLDRALGPIAVGIRKRQQTAGSDQRAGILAGRGERLLEVRDRVRLPGAPLGGPQQEQQRRALTRGGRFCQRAPHVVGGDLGRAAVKRLTRRVAQPLDHPLVPGRAAREQMRRDAVAPRRQPLLACRRQQLAHKQRIPAGQLPARRAERLVGILVQLRAHDRANRRPAQRPKRDPLHPTIAHQLLELAALATRIARAQTQHQQHGQIPRPSRQIPKPRQRRIINPLHVIDHYQQRTTLSPIRAQPKQPVNRREPVRRRLTRLHAQRPRTHPRNTSQQPTPLPWRSRAQHRLKQLTRNPERDLLLKLRPPRAQHPKPTRLRARPHRRQQLALPDPSHTLYNDDRPSATTSRIEQTTHQPELKLTLQQLTSAHRMRRLAHRGPKSGRHPARTELDTAVLSHDDSRRAWTCGLEQSAR